MRRGGRQPRSLRRGPSGLVTRSKTLLCAFGVESIIRFAEEVLSKLK